MHLFASEYWLFLFLTEDAESEFGNTAKNKERI
jgi:hypothetical protein